eukprot:1713184-Alexandrium_andersonii.AAC.1
MQHLGWLPLSCSSVQLRRQPCQMQMHRAEPHACLEHCHEAPTRDSVADASQSGRTFGLAHCRATLVGFSFVPEGGGVG